jgi:hypothetical protein
MNAKAIAKLALPLIARLSRRRTSKSLTAAAVLMTSLAWTGEIQAVPIGIELGESAVLINAAGVETPRYSFTGLNGTPVLGSVSLDIVFNNAEFVRLFTATTPGFSAVLNLQTDGSGFQGFLFGTGYLLDAQGNAIPGFGITGSASGDDGSMGISLFPLFKDRDGTPNDQLQRPLDFYGVHYDFTFPTDPGVQVTSAWFQLVDNGTTAFGVGPSVPGDILFVPPDAGLNVKDGGSGMLGLLSVSFALLVGMKIRTASVA